jgi:hypothetical protein
MLFVYETKVLHENLLFKILTASEWFSFSSYCQKKKQKAAYLQILQISSLLYAV